MSRQHARLIAAPGATIIIVIVVIITLIMIIIINGISVAGRVETREHSTTANLAARREAHADGEKGKKRAKKRKERKKGR